ncbi:putative ferric-chelate reductase 1 [Mercenaria mercenaria]|uniref:putative ferric-chelate reductase 1 n=1 Tax=Mercenaria mercenaria TaxID=6596 RepID=UPI00234E9D0B|nr:putative ferric-chelate reductase 1 [Mercenaria mercenaria]
MRQRTLYQLVVILCTQLCVCTCYHYGPPATEHVCRNMFPEGHHVDAQTSEPPFEIDLSQNVYTPWEEVQVTLRATQGYFFRGFFMQARRADCSHVFQYQPLGVFTVLPEDQNLMKTMPCLNHKDSAISHRTNQSFGKAVFRWNAPAAMIGHLYFTATVVKEQDIFWTNVKSVLMRDQSDKRRKGEYCPTKSRIDPHEINTTPRPSRGTTEKLQESTTVTCGCHFNKHCIFQLAFSVTMPAFLFKKIVL